MTPRTPSQADAAPAARVARRWMTPRRFVLASLVALVLAELVLRRIGYASLPVTVMDGSLGWVLLPDQDRPGRYGEGLRINGYGMRDRDWAEPGVDAAAPRVVVLGDSRPYGYGVPVEATFPRRLEALLARSEPSAVVMNFGQPGHHLGQFDALYEGLARRWRPDVVVVCVGTVAITPPLPPLAPRRIPLAHLVARTALWDALDRRFFIARHGREAREAWIRAGKLEAAEAAQRGFRVARDTPFSPEAAPLWAAAGDDLARLAGRVAEDGGHLVVLVLPRRSELAPGIAEELGVRWRSLAAPLDPERVTVLEVADALRPMTSPFLASDTEHLTPEGHAKVAEALGALAAFARRP